MVVAYMMRYEGVGAAEGVRRLRGKRERVKPNTNFMKQLEVYEQELGRKTAEKENKTEAVVTREKFPQTPSNKANHPR